MKIKEIFRDYTVKKALRDSLPVLTGYLMVGIGFGILLVDKGYPPWLAVAMGFVMYAGAGQFLAVDLMVSKASLISSAIMTLAINARYFFYGIALLPRYKDLGAQKPLMVMEVTDETFSLVCREDATVKTDPKRYYTLLSHINHLYWVLGCSIGGFVGNALTVDFSGVEFAMSALFLVTLIDQWRASRHHGPALIGLIVTAVCLVIFGPADFVIPAMLGITLLLILCKPLLERRDVPWI